MNISGLSGNEVYCLRRKGWAPGGVVVGNSVQSLGFAGGIGRAFKTMAGGEIENLTQLISEGRHAALKRIEREAQERGAGGLTGVTLEVKTIGGMIEFLAIGSAIHREGEEGRGRERERIAVARSDEPRRGEGRSASFFSTACSGQDLYCHIDAGYEPRHLVLGNVAYAMGIGRGITGAFRQFSARGEVKEFSDMYNHTRHLALGRLEDEAEERGCNAVVDIITRVVPMSGALEILMVGTGSYNPALSKQDQPATSELTGEELWNLTQMGYEPVRLVLGTSVYSLGLAGGIKAMFRSMSRGEVPEMTHLVHEARENCLDHLDADARDYGAEAVIGTKLFISELGSGLIEVLAIGTAVRRNAAMKTQSEQLLPQVIIRDRDTFFDQSLSNLTRDHSEAPRQQAVGAQSSPLGCLIALIILGLVFGGFCLFIGVMALLSGMK
jgi:uncharacterized protein YbjQ (UPF0145 family)